LTFVVIREYLLAVLAFCLCFIIGYFAPLDVPFKIPRISFLFTRS
jgi:hypothetical protein